MVAEHRPPTNNKASAFIKMKRWWLSRDAAKSRENSWLCRVAKVKRKLLTLPRRSRENSWLESPKKTLDFENSKVKRKLLTGKSRENSWLRTLQSQEETLDLKVKSFSHEKTLEWIPGELSAPDRHALGEARRQGMSGVQERLRARANRVELGLLVLHELVDSLTDVVTTGISLAA